MKEINTRRLKDVLRKHFGFTRGSGGMTGHETWVNHQGRRIHPVLRHKAVPLASVYCIGLELEAQGVCSRVEFLRAIKAA
jgi:hypothetical protein